MTEDQKTSTGYRAWEYAAKGDYHRDLDPNWSYTPTYLCKMAFIRQLIRQLPAGARILDAGCGEGVLVQEFRNQGRLIEGLDLNYESECVQQGSVLALPYAANSFDLVLLLDIFEHLSFIDQPLALKEVHRVLGRDGQLIASIPNLAHCNSRFRMFFKGRLDRTDIETNHPGERPYEENKQLLQQAGFNILINQGITLTLPLVYRRLICRRPAAFRWLHDLLEPLAVPSLAMLNIFVCQKR